MAGNTAVIFDSLAGLKAYGLGQMLQGQVMVCSPPLRLRETGGTRSRSTRLHRQGATGKSPKGDFKQDSWHDNSSNGTGNDSPVRARQSQTVNKSQSCIDNYRSSKNSRVRLFVAIGIPIYHECGKN